ncbi:hypothetical protein [Sphingomonas sp. DT-207]|uniref:hypothetical protein n=1 Tax=Sphingomonas sp. DT-207 TaxID=3396167 RepID=UPI003F540AD8
MQASPVQSSSNQGEAALKYVRVVQWSAKDGSIHLEMLGEDQEIHRFEVSSECSGALAAALAAESERFNGQDNEQQLIRPKGMQTAKTDRGEPMLLMTLEGGVELPLVFKPESLDVLISELEGLKKTILPGSQIRWH